MYVKIIRSSIKKNPRAGEEFSQVPTNVEVSFSYDGAPPKGLDNEEGVFITEFNDNYTAGILLHDGLIPIVEKYGITNVKVVYGKEQIYHQPLPDYLYEYENPEVTCKNCHNSIKVAEIERGADDDGYGYTACPICKTIDTFEDIQYEDIKAALNTH